MAYPNGMVFDEFRYATGDIDVFRKVGRSWQPWVLVRKSTLPNAGMGLFAARPFATDELIGRYVGKILGHVKSPAVQDMVERMSRAASTTIKWTAVSRCSPTRRSGGSLEKSF